MESSQDLWSEPVEPTEDPQLLCVRDSFAPDLVLPRTSQTSSALRFSCVATNAQTVADGAAGRPFHPLT